MLNIVFLRDYFINASGILLYNKGLYEDSKSQFIKLNSFEGLYNNANSIYKLESYSGALNIYEGINCESSIKCFYVKNNLGNTYYKLSVQADVIDKQIQYLEYSALNYKEALKIKYDEQSEKNLEFVLNLINKLKEEENKNDNEETSENSKSEDSNETSENSENNKQDEQSGSGTNAFESSDVTENEGEIGGLTPEQIQAIEQYEKSLEQSQKYVGEHYNKVYEEQNNINDEFEAFFGINPFFDNSLLDEYNDKKDW
ncbi:MAG: hypothetical protein PHH06_03655 [Candidatus Gracilibacteria bacterium]|nr:hypothetical protein [Candidatus Gracilibacteria bacterium]